MLRGWKSSINLSTFSAVRLLGTTLNTKRYSGIEGHMVPIVSLLGLVGAVRDRSDSPSSNSPMREGPRLRIAVGGLLGDIASAAPVPASAAGEAA